MFVQLYFTASPQDYTRTGFNKVHRTVRVQGREVSLTVWDTSGADPTTITLRK
jgi:hypothetical protein